MPDQLSLEESDSLVMLKGAWKRVLEKMKDNVAETVYTRFLLPLRPYSFEDDVAVIVAPGKFIHEWIKEKYLDKLERALTEDFGRPVRMHLLAEPREKAVVHTATSSAVTTISPVSDRPVFRPNEKFTFGEFVEGQSNRLALAGARAVAESPGTKFNPLFIYGASGLGKTHLMHAIGNAILEREPQNTVRYISAQQFTEDFVQALKNNRIDQFRRMQRSVNVWLVDDIQLILGKDKTQEEIFNTFNYLHNLGKQIVLCSDRAPRDLLPMDERLRSRFESGLVADVQMPDTETRCAIVLKKAERDNLALSHDTAMFLAESVPGNIRVLEGALTKLAAHASLDGTALDRALAEQIVEDYYRNAITAKPTFDQIVGLISRHYQIGVEEIKGTSRKAPVAHARHVAVYMTREILGDSWKHIGALFGNRDHTSMMHGYKKIRSMMNTDKELSASVKMLMRDLYPES